MLGAEALQPLLQHPLFKILDLPLAGAVGARGPQGVGDAGMGL